MLVVALSQVADPPADDPPDSVAPVLPAASPDAPAAGDDEPPVEPPAEALVEPPVEPSSRPIRRDRPLHIAPPDDGRPMAKKKKDWKVGYKDGFFIKSPDRNFKLLLTGQLQVRYRLDRRVEDDGDPDKIRSTFELRRTKLKASGHVLGPWLRYSVTGAWDSGDNTIELQSAWGLVELTDDLSLRLGRFRPSLLREERVSSKRQLAAERSVVSTTFRQTRTGAAELVYKMKNVRLRGAIFQSTSDIFEDDAWFLSSRVEWLLDGKWRKLKDFTSFPNKKGALAVGAGILYGYEDRNDAFETDSDLLRWTVDVSAEFGGANAFAAIIGNHLAEEGQPTLNQFGAVVQGGVFVGKGVELFTRYEWGDADGLAPDLSTITVGINGYFDKHRAKFTADVGYGLNEVADFWSSSRSGWRTDDPGESGQIVLRAQFQLLF